MKARGQLGWLVIAMLVIVGLLPAVLTMAEDNPIPSVVINEVAWAGSSMGPADEWIELKNISESEVNLAGWQILIDNPGPDYTVTVPHGESSILPSDGFFIVAKYGTGSDNSALDVIIDIGLEFFGFGITNSGFTITLKNSVGELVDTAWNGSTPTMGYRNSTGSASMERRAGAANGELPASWQEATASVNFDDIPNVTNYGTPKSENSVIVEPPTIESILPNQAEVDSVLHIESIIGTNFATDPLPTVQLKREGQTITADNIHTVTPTLIDTGQFSLFDASVGYWDLVVTNPDGATATLPQAIEVTEPEKEYDLTTTVRLNEVHPQPNTTSNDEYIELHNYGDQTVNLEGWVLDDIRDGGSSPFTISARNILPKSYLTLYKSETKITLNDSGDSVFLIQPNGFELDRTAYDSSPRGQTWARFDDGWSWTSSPTPNGKNVMSRPQENEDSETVDEPDDTPITPSFKKGDILITELLPNPVEGEEFIELYNATGQPIDLKNWGLADKAKHKYKISNFAVSIQTANGLTVQPQQYVVVTNTMSGIALNNTGGESVTLTDPAGNVIASASYPDKAPADATYVLVDETWTWSNNPTPAGVNILELDEADEAPPQVDIVLPDTLPITGASTRKWLGFGLVGMGLGAVVCLRYVRRRYKKFG